MTEQTQPTDAELRTWVQSLIADDDSVRANDERDHMNFARAVLAKWGTPPAVAGEKVYLVATGLTNEAGTVGLYERHDRFVPLADCEVLYTAPQPTQAQAGAVPLTREQVKAICVESGYEKATLQERADFINGIRHAERHHGIKGGQHVR